MKFAARLVLSPLVAVVVVVGSIIASIAASSAMTAASFALRASSSSSSSSSSSIPGGGGRAGQKGRLSSSPLSGDAVGGVRAEEAPRLSTSPTSSRTTKTDDDFGGGDFVAAHSNYRYEIRPFDPRTDQAALVDICRNVYGGSDYLPNISRQLASDPSCTFLAAAAAAVIDDDDGTDDEHPKLALVAAVGNLRVIKKKTGNVVMWLEAVRTCRRHRRRGLARRLVSELLLLVAAGGGAGKGSTATAPSFALEEGGDNDSNNNNNNNDSNDSDCREKGSGVVAVYSCTVKSNIAMQKVFDKVGMKLIGKIHQCSFKELQKLPGWGTDEEANNGRDSRRIADAAPLQQPLLQSIGLAETAIPEARRRIAVAENWSVVESEHELDAILADFRRKSSKAIGHLVGLYELLPDSAVGEAIRSGRVWKLRRESSSSAPASTTTEPATSAVLAFTRDEKIASLRSKWVCTVSATSAAAFDSAMWYACYGCHSTSSTATLREVLEGDVAFTVAFDAAIPMIDEDSVVAKALPLTDDDCLLFGTTADADCRDSGIVE